MDSITTNFADVLLWTFWLFVLIGALVLWGLVMVDLFTDRSLSGWAKTGWFILLILLPWLGVLIYLVARDVSKRRLSEDLHRDVS